MKILRIAAFAFVTLAFSSICSFAQIRPLIRVLPDVPVKSEQQPGSNVVLSNISSTAGGGAWSSPSTWVGGVVPGSGDNVIIVGGAAVLVDTAAAAGTLTVGSGGTPAVLTFDPFAARSLTVAGDLTISGATDILTTPSTGAVTNHTLIIGGSLTNNGIFDLSTNSNQAGADLVFTGASNNTFGGSGSVTDIRTITMDKGTSSANLLDLTASNFTVQGSTTDSAASAFLTLTNGTFKISGTFTGNHRTAVLTFDLNIAAFEQIIVPTSGLWLNNPNYTLTSPPNSRFLIKGLFHVSAGTLNAANTNGSSIMLDQREHPSMFVDGGTINLSGNLISSAGTNPVTYSQSGGKVTTCIDANVGSGCFNIRAGTTTFSGGEIVIQNPAPPAAPPSSNTEDFRVVGAVGTGTKVTFGNTSTVAVGPFISGGGLPNINLDTSAGPQTLYAGGALGNVNIEPGGTLNIGNGGFQVLGDSFVNDGTLIASGGVLNFHGTGPTADVTYSGSGTMTGKFSSLRADCRTVTFGPSVGSVNITSMELHETGLVNSSKIRFVDNANIVIFGDALFDSTPVYDLTGTGGVNITHWGGYTTGPEIPANRIVKDITNHGPGPLVLSGGDLTVTGSMSIGSYISQGANKITHLGVNGGGGFTGYVDGVLARPFSGSQVYTYLVGENNRKMATVFVTGVQTSPTTLSMKAFDSAMPGLPAGTAATVYWHIDTTGPISGNKIDVQYNNADVAGNENKYRIWHRVGSGPIALCGGAAQNTGANTISCTGFSDFAGDWGIAEFDDPGPVSISGRVLEANGNPIRDAYVTLSAEGRPPVTFQTGSLGNYIFQNLEAGIIYTLTGSAKRHRFATMEQQLVPLGNMADVNFVANPPE